MVHTNPPRNADLPPGYDENDPYAHDNLDEYPKWWRQNIEEFQQYNLRPYRPPRFVDETLVPSVVNELQEELDINIQLRTTNPDIDATWEVRVDGGHVMDINKRRDGEGYTEFIIETDTFKRQIRLYVSGDDG